ncbi:hypothetical protein WKR88_00480 [Trinickia caryophylli]|uniref:hypothetical protein n=1 Tax=Trinickia caryophylli TaxID=28094 RepID=UPI00111C6AD4|nr:hypothetical protein [Trinickia caryophylli]TRX15244.1 hypothetical protein FNF07_29130 [Trinickia caryophylli]WQE15117.1 hypothetical protein U0034_21450 [Trinickia caryophylli]GLU31145.1 hypothetical protein Busp01_09870 [Trinickia caryophylli]
MKSARYFMGPIAALAIALSALPVCAGAATHGEAAATAKRVTPPPKPAVATQVMPGIPDLEKWEVDHGRGMPSRFTSNRFRALDGTYERE